MDNNTDGSKQKKATGRASSKRRASSSNSTPEESSTERSTEQAKPPAVEVKSVKLSEACEVDMLKAVLSRPLLKRAGSSTDPIDVSSDPSLETKPELPRLRSSRDTSGIIVKIEGEKTSSKRRAGPEVYFEQSAKRIKTERSNKDKSQESDGGSSSNGLLGYVTSGAIGAALGVGVRMFFF